MKKLVLYLSIAVISGISSYAISSNEKSDDSDSNYIVLRGIKIDENKVKCPGYGEGTCVIHKSIVGISVSAEEYRRMQDN